MGRGALPAMSGGVRSAWTRVCLTRGDDAPDFNKGLWIQLNKGDKRGNRTIYESVIDHSEVEFFQDHKLPLENIGVFFHQLALQFLGTHSHFLPLLPILLSSQQTRQPAVVNLLELTLVLLQGHLHKLIQLVPFVVEDAESGVGLIENAVLASPLGNLQESPQPEKYLHSLAGLIVHVILDEVEHGLH